LLTHQSIKDHLTLLQLLAMSDHRNSMPSPHQSTLLCSNVIKFARRQNRRNHALFTGQKKIFGCISNCRYTARITSKCARASPRQCAYSDPDFIQIGSLSAEL